MTRRCSEYDGLNAKKVIKGAFGDGVMASHQLGALLGPTTALYYAKCYLCKSTKANNALQSHERPHVPRRRVSNPHPQQRLSSSTSTSQSKQTSLGLRGASSTTAYGASTDSLTMFVKTETVEVNFES